MCILYCKFKAFFYLLTHPILSVGVWLIYIVSTQVESICTYTNRRKRPCWIPPTQMILQENHDHQLIKHMSSRNHTYGTFVGKTTIARKQKKLPIVLALSDVTFCVEPIAWILSRIWSNSTPSTNELKSLIHNDVSHIVVLPSPTDFYLFFQCLISRNETIGIRIMKVYWLGSVLHAQCVLHTVIEVRGNNLFRILLCSLHHSIFSCATRKHRMEA